MQPCAERFERNFATNAALTKPIIRIRILRSRFGPADSWVIKAGGGRQLLPWDINLSRT
jgi:hypothetical protein